MLFIESVASYRYLKCNGHRHEDNRESQTFETWTYSMYWSATNGPSGPACVRNKGMRNDELKSWQIRINTINMMRIRNQGTSYLVPSFRAELMVGYPGTRYQVPPSYPKPKLSKTVLFLPSSSYLLHTGRNLCLCIVYMRYNTGGYHT